GSRAISPWLCCGRPTPWKRPSRSNSLSAPISSRTSSVGKSSTRMITPSHSLRKVFGSRAKMSCAMASISASEGAFAEVHIGPVLEHSLKEWELVFFLVAKGRRVRLTLRRQSETVGCYEVWGHLDAQSDSGNIGSLCRDSVSGRPWSRGADRVNACAGCPGG